MYLEGIFLRPSRDLAWFFLIEPTQPEKLKTGPYRITLPLAMSTHCIFKVLDRDLSRTLSHGQSELQGTCGHMNSTKQELLKQSGVNRNHSWDGNSRVYLAGKNSKIMEWRIS